MALIKINNLTKLFGKHAALDGISLEVNEGEIFGFIGPNGAGKSTTIRILLGLLKKTSGEVALFDGDPWSDAVRLHKRLAYVPSDVKVWSTLTGGEVIDLLARLRGNLNIKRREELIQRFSFDPTKKARAYSKGNRQKMLIIAAFASDAELFLLDEPTGGLDPLMAMEFQNIVREAKTEGKTIFLSSHILSEVENLCDRVSIIKQGKIVETGALSDLRHLTRISMTIESHTPIQGLAELRGVHNVKEYGGRTSFSVDPEALNDTLKHLSGFGVRALTSAPPTLEELFLRHYAISKK